MSFSRETKRLFCEICAHLLFKARPHRTRVGSGAGPRKLYIKKLYECHTKSAARVERGPALKFGVTYFVQFLDIQHARVRVATRSAFGVAEPLEWTMFGSDSKAFDLIPILSENPPYNKRAFLIEINFPIEYPFRPPKIVFITRIYHPNIDERGDICFPIIDAENWKPGNQMYEVIISVVCMVNNPEPEWKMRPEVALQYVKNREKFMAIAAAATIQHGLRKPAKED